MNFTENKAIELVNSILKDYVGLEITDEEKADLVILAIESAPKSYSKNGPESYVRAVITNTIREKIRKHVMLRMGE